VVAMIVVGVAVIPPYFSNYQFQDDLKQEALASTYSTKSEDDIRDEVIKRARNFDIALDPKEVTVQRTGGLGSGSLYIEADYAVPISLPGYSFELHFSPSTKNKGVY